MLNNLELYVQTYHFNLDFYPSSFTALKTLSYIIIQNVWNILAEEDIEGVLKLFDNSRQIEISKLKFTQITKENANIIAYYILDEIILKAKAQQIRCKSFLISSDHIYNGVFLDKDLRWLCWGIIKNNPTKIISTEEIERWGQYNFADYEALSLVINYLYITTNFKELISSIPVEASFNDIKTELIVKILVVVKESISYVKELASSDMIIKHILYNSYCDLNLLLK